MRFGRVPWSRVVVARKNREWNNIPSDTRQIRAQLAQFSQVPSLRQSPLSPAPVSRDRRPTTAPFALAPRQPLSMSQHSILAQLQASNDEWRNAVLKVSPDFFERGAKGQTPKVLWFGCADSRVPESVVLAAKPGDLFVHRNIAKSVSRRSLERALQFCN